MRPLHAVLIVILAGVAVYCRTLAGPFLSWDDIQHFQFNSALKNGDFARFWTAEYYGLYIPLTYSVWTLLYRVSSSPMTFHALNLVLHTANSLLVLFIAKEWTQSLRSALFIALIFALHPLQVEAVAWISGGRDLLSAFFGLLAIAAVVRQKPHLATLSFALGLLAKPALAPLGLALFLWRRLSTRLTIAWLALGSAALVVTSRIQGPFAQLRVEVIPWWQRPVVALDALGFYVRQILVPWPLSSDYGRIPADVIAHNWFLSSLAVLAVAGGVAYYVGRRLDWKPLLFTLAMLSPVLGLVPFEAQVQSTVFDRYMYLAMLGVAFLLMSLVREFKAPSWLAPAVLAIWAGVSFTRTGDWLSNRRLFTDILEHNPRNYFAQTNFALEEMADHNLDSAERHLLIARDLNPRLALAWANLFHVHWQKRDPGAILNEAKPLLNNPAFLSYNQHEPQALALLYRMVARSQNAVQHRDEARWAYIQARAFNPDDDELRTEVELFEREVH